jgi:hypothetical protein
MKKTIAALALATLTFGVLQQPARADDDWFNSHDRDHDQRWNYNEFKNAHQTYYRTHHDDHDRWNNKQIKEHWNGLNSNGYVTREQVTTLHHW